MKRLIELSLFLELKGPNLAPHHLEGDRFRPLIMQSNYSTEISRIAGSNAAPYYFGFKGTNSGPSLCDQTMGSKSVLMPLLATNTKVLKNNY